ncbi:MAG TPA: hypothetical protein VKR59_07970 [Terriglobales bacterium]|nr:hypothetical protein [Terriglobales bacterium]
MPHTTEVVNVQHLADSQIAVTLRCCSDASTDSVHTIEVSGDNTEADLKAWLDGRHAHVQGLHDKRETATAFFESLKAKAS